MSLLLVGLPLSRAQLTRKERKRSQILLGIAVLSLGPVLPMLSPCACRPASQALSSDLSTPFQTRRLVTAKTLKGAKSHAWGEAKARIA